MAEIHITRVLKFEIHYASPRTSGKVAHSSRALVSPGLPSLAAFTMAPKRGLKRSYDDLDTSKIPTDEEFMRMPEQEICKWIHYFIDKDMHHPVMFSDFGQSSVRNRLSPGAFMHTTP